MTGVREEPSAPARQTARSRLYRAGSLALEDFPVAEVSDHLSEPDGVVWLDLYDPDESDLEVVGEELGLHSLAIEDAVQRDQRPKLDHYEGHLFLTGYSAALDRRSGALTTAEVAVFATDRARVTVHWPDGFDIDAVVARWDAADLPLDGVGALLHGVLDMVADGHLDAVRALDEELDTLEAALFDDQSVDRELFRKAARLRRSLSALRRLTQPMREILSALMNHELDERLRPYFHDIQDHVVLGDEEGDRLGRHHRGTHCHHRVLRPEPAISRSRANVGFLGVHRRDLQPVGCVVRLIQTPRLDINRE